MEQPVTMTWAEPAGQPPMAPPPGQPSPNWPNQVGLARPHQCTNL